ncbi:hypothetical protein ACHAXR_011450 [Thalassiosira sp. AJA248-18]
MALRAFQFNPSIGGFGRESQLLASSSQSGIGAGRSSRVARPLTQGNDDPAKNDDGDIGTGSCDAFAQIVKELVDNAVDACAPVLDDSNANNKDADQEKKTAKRVRIHITSATVPVRSNVNDKDIGNSDSNPEKTQTMDCLRVVISDNGCGMENIDDCVTAFRTNKNGAMNQRCADNEKDEQRTGEKSVSESTNKKGGKKQNNENYTSGRYGVGLTLCLLHAQRLVPGCGACITSATASADDWTRATYEPDTDADNIVCMKKEHFPKEIEGDCGTNISLFVPGGEEAERAFSRLAEYFARFQLSTDLPCSIEVKAPTLQSRPLYIRPPAEIERRMNRKRNKSLGANSLMDVSDANSDSDENSNKHNWDGGDCLDERNSPVAEINQPRTSKAARQRAEAELQKKKKISLMCKAAAAYKSRPDLRVENVAYSSQPIRRKKSGSGQSSTSSANGPLLEIGLIVFGPEPDTGNYCDENSDHESCHRDCGNGRKSLATLQVVRMVNGIPLLDSSEALACGVVQKMSNSAVWNSFGLNVLQNSENDLDLDPVPLSLEINDSAQVAPFLKSTAHSMFHDQSQGNDQSSSDEDDFDVENFRGKRKKERQVRCLLPAALRLGDVLVVVQIRAKPSALPLPTLSKGRLPLNDKGISDALENGISDCLRCLQRSSPGLLLTAHQLKRVERDVKYVPSVAGAIASVLCKSKQIGVYDSAKNIASGWDDDVKKNVSCSNDLETVQMRGRARSAVAERNNPMHSQANEEKLRVDALRPILERRLRLVISDEFKDSKRAEEKEQQRRGREELAAAKRAKKKKAVESDGMKSDCFESDGGCSNSRHPSVAESASGTSPKNSARDDLCGQFDSHTSPVVNTRRRYWKGDSAGSADHSSVAESSEDGNHKKSSRDDFESDSSVAHAGRCLRKGSLVSKHSSVGRSQRSPKKSSNDDFDSDLSSPLVNRERNRVKKNSVGSREHPCSGSQRENNPKKSSADNFNSQVSSPAVHIGYGDDFDDGYDSSPRLGKKNASIARKHHDDMSRSECCHSSDKSAKRREDAMSSDSEWSSQYGEVVSGHFFH